MNVQFVAYQQSNSASATVYLTATTPTACSAATTKKTYLKPRRGKYDIIPFMGNKNSKRIFNNECPICLEEDEEMDRLVCGHGVHRHSCLPDNYAPIECPICRVPFKYRKDPIRQPHQQLHIQPSPPPHIQPSPQPSIQNYVSQSESERIIESIIFNRQLYKYISQINAYCYTFNPRFKNKNFNDNERIIMILLMHYKSGLSQNAVSLCAVKYNGYVSRAYNIVYGIYSPQMRLDDIIYLVVSGIKYPIIIRHMNRFHMPLFDISPLINYLSPYSEIKFEYPEHIRDLYILGGSVQLELLRKIGLVVYNQCISSPFKSYPIQRQLVSSVSYMAGLVAISWDLMQAGQYISTYKHVLANGMRRWKARRESVNRMN